MKLPARRLRVRSVRERDGRARRRGGIWSGEDENGQGKKHGPALAKDGSAQDIIHESLARWRAGPLPLECRQIAIDGVMDEEHR